MSAIRDSSLAEVRALAQQLHPHADVIEQRERVSFWQGRRTGYACVVRGHTVATGSDLAALKAALEKRLAPRVPADPTDERLPLR